MKPLQILFLCFCSLFSRAQKNDSLFLSFSEFLKNVKEYHPVSRQSALLLPLAEAGVMSARGQFDPKLWYTQEQKQYDNKNYWNIQNGSLKIPTLPGLEFTAGYDRNIGSNTNPEHATSTNGLAYTQISMPLLQGLLIDERRFALKNAKLFRDLSLLEQKNMLNELFSKASKSYWEWAQSYYNLQVIREGVQLADQRLQGIKQAALLGDNAHIDTLEASIQYQDRLVTMQQQEMDFYSKTLLLSVFLWTDKNEALELSSPLIPPSTEDLDNTDLSASILPVIDSLTASHPVILSYQNKKSRLALEFKLKQDKLKPVLNAKFNPLYNPSNLQSSVLYGNNSYKWGLSFQVPLLLRKERGELKIAKLKLKDVQYETDYKKAEITNKLKASLNEYTNTKNQLAQFNTIVQNYNKLLQAEKKLFDLGESSVFMVNSREMSYLNSRLKLNDLMFKYRKAAVDMLYHSGQLYSLPQ
ncbi:MAG TPA: TolC family protein [Chitinophagaceae bacterium]|nr:TolC family protein [Chitinophagaceae bacterium]